jgi:hypothetical protein
MAGADLDDVAGRLYALPPEDFTAARDAEAKALAPPLRGQVKALRRPTVAAWLVNRLAAEEPDLLDQLLELGPSLAAAQEQGRGEDLRALGQQRRELVSAVAGTAAGLSGRAVGPQVRLEVEQTLEAALADPDSAEAVRSGRLVRALSYAGFGGVDLAGAVATPPSAARPSRAATKARSSRPAPDPVATAEARALEASAALDDAVRRCEDAERVRADAEQRAAVTRRAADRAAAEVDRLETELASAREQAAAAAVSAAGADDALDRAGTAARARRETVAETQDAAERARAQLDRLRRG